MRPQPSTGSLPDDGSRLIAHSLSVSSNGLRDGFQPSVARSCTMCGFLLVCGEVTVTKRTVLMLLLCVWLGGALVWQPATWAKSPDHHGKATAKVTSAQSTPQEIAQGKKLFDTFNCASCHSVENKGGCLAPPLDCVSVRHPDDYLLLRLGQGEEDKFIKRIGHPELFPHPRFPKKELHAVIAYLRTLPCELPPKGTKHSHTLPADKQPAQAPGSKKKS
jgi:mono/diheme cytochrome c family protein